MTTGSPDAKDRVATVKGWLDELLDAPVSERSGLLARYRLEDAASADEVADLLVAYEAGTPAVARDAPAEPDAPTPDTAAEPLGTLPVELGPYTLEELVGIGGMGRVYRARQREPIARTVAVKVLHTHLMCPNMVERFRRERELLALLDAPSIARVLDAGERPGVGAFMVMEYVDGRPITDYCRDRALSLRQRVQLTIDAAHGLQHAHSRGVLHRDVKPSNLLVTDAGGAPAVKVIDFGIAKPIRPIDGETLVEATRDGQVIGTLAYMSPEQAGIVDEVPDVRSDVYSLALVLHEVLTGRLPSGASGSGVVGLAALVEARSQEEQSIADLTRLTRASDDLERACLADLGVVLRRALQRDPCVRYATANAFATDLERVLRGLPVMARRSTRRYVVSRFVRRHRFATAAAVVAVLALVAAGAALTVGLLREREHVGELRTALDEADDLVAAYGRLLLGVRADERGPDTLLRDVVDEAADTILADPTLGGAARGRLAAAAGEALYDLEQFDAAEGVLDLAHGLLAEDARATARTRILTAHRLGDVALGRGEFDRARALFADAREVARDAVDASEERAFVVSEERLAALLDESGDSASAIELQEDALERAEGLGNEAEQSGMRTSLAISYVHAGRYADAERMARVAFDERSARLPAGDARLVNTVRVLVDALLGVGETDEALALAEQAVAANELPDDDPRSALLAVWHARVALRVARAPARADTLLAAVEHAESLAAGSRRMRFMLETLRIEALLHGPAYDPSEDVEDLLAAMREALGAHHPDLARAHATLGRSLQAAGRGSLAAPHLEVALAEVRARNARPVPLANELAALLEAARGGL